MNILVFLTILAYALVIGDQVLRLLGKQLASPKRFFTFSFLAIIGHTILLYQWIETANGQDLSIMNLASMMTWLMGLLILTPGLKKPLANLALLIFPFSILSIIGASLSSSHHIVSTQLHKGVLLHILISILATSVLGLSAFQATLLWGQNHLLKTHHPNIVLRILPSLETMENFLFALIRVGFVLLTASLVTGFLYIEAFFSQALLPKTGFAICAWGLFLILLLGHHFYGWRGTKAIHFTLGGIAALLIGYFGTQFWFSP